jgi:hypothetical protein
MGGEKDEVSVEETPVFVEELLPLTDRVIVECLEATGMAKQCVSATVRELGPPQEAVCLCVALVCLDEGVCSNTPTGICVHIRKLLLLLCVCVCVYIYIYILY